MPNQGFGGVSAPSFPAGPYLIDSVGPIAGLMPSISFNSIPQTFRNLKLLVTARLDFAATEDMLVMQFNGDTGGNYATQELRGSATVVAATEQDSNPVIFLGRITANTATATARSHAVIGFPNYIDSIYWKTIDCIASNATGIGSGNHRTQIFTGYWHSTAAITSISLFPSTSTTAIAGTGNFMAGSYFALYAEY